jgi:hypothetical protein
MPSLFCAELYLLVTSLFYIGSILQIFKGNLLAFLCVREYSILGYSALKELGQAKIVIAVIAKQTHYSTRFEDRRRKASRQLLSRRKSIDIE